MRAILLLTGVALAACATQAGFDARMQAFVGTREGDLVQALGVPDGDFTTPEGRRFLQYERLGTSTPTPIVGVGFGGVGWRGGYGTGWGIGTAYPAYAPPPPCRVTFEMRDGRVASFTRSGGGCVATPPGD
ncbi:hypothetical protein GXW74_22185 [Roseomonas eburnea]|uniref:Lipoprotein n=1 Tax=Neoroseomonas eburnea TaxID=1346889 RepID=A0A9X9XHM7_9PROT|nr:hypothetical protein [Neoroseomonas eburnea]MBR0683213.1 hypothetical protein [Neoroseomonas eburnea]